MHEQESIEKLLIAYERSLLEPVLRKSERVLALLADSFVEFGSSERVFTKAQIVAAWQLKNPVEVLASDFNVRLLATEVALVTYRTERRTMPPVCALRNSIWVQREGKWQMVFHQGTLSNEQI
jgi:hypothetical protein